MLPDPRHIAKTAVVGALGLALTGAGLVLLLRAVWIALVLSWGPMWTAAAMGGALVIIGGATLALLMRRPRRLPPPPASPLTAVIAAFAQGYGSAQALKSRR